MRRFSSSKFGEFFEGKDSLIVRGQREKFSRKGIERKHGKD